MHTNSTVFLQTFKGYANRFKFVSGFITRSFAERMVKAFYAVAAGRRTGVYDTWAQCESQVKGFPGARFKKFATLEEAQSFAGGKQVAFQKANASVGKRGASSYKPVHDYIDDENDLPPAKRRKAILLDYNKEKNRDFNVDDKGFVNVYTDGACSSNGRKGATAGIGVWFGDNHELNVSKPLEGEPTNNRAEINAVLVAVQQAKSAGIKKLKINTDSNFLISCMTQWMPSWKRNGWLTAKKQPVLHKKQLLELEATMSGLEICWNHVRGHAGIHGNEMADKLAREGCNRN